MVVPWLHKPSSLVVPASPWPSCPTSVGLCSFSTTSLCHGVQNSDSKCCPTTTTLSGNSKKLVPHDSHQVWNTSEVRKTLYFHLRVHCCSGASTEHLTFYLQGHLLPRSATSLSYTSQLSTAPANLFFFSLGTLASCYLGWLCNEYFVKYVEDQTPMLRTYLVLDVLISHFATLHSFSQLDPNLSLSIILQAPTFKACSKKLTIDLDFWKLLLAAVSKILAMHKHFYSQVGLISLSNKFWPPPNWLSPDEGKLLLWTLSLHFPRITKLFKVSIFTYL